MTTNRHQLIVQKVVVVGHNKNYVVDFDCGLNIVYGDSDTGKSTVAHLIDYCLGAKTFDLYDEIEVAALHCLMQVRLREDVYTIKRDIFRPNDFVEVYRGEFDAISEVFPMVFGPDYSTQGPQGYYSDFLLEALGLPVVKVKESPSKADSRMTRLSFRDLMKYMYLDQDDVGHKFLLSHGTAAYPVATKNKECFKYIFNLLDSQITDIQGEISEKTQKRNALEEKLRSVQAFFRDTDFYTMSILQEKIDDLTKHEEAVDEEISKLNSKMSSNTGLHNELRETVQAIDGQLKENLQQQRIVQGNIERFVKLKNEYVRDIQKIKSSIQVQERVVGVVTEGRCPVCDGTIQCNSTRFDIISLGDKKTQLSLLNIRAKDVALLIDKDRVELSATATEYDKLSSQLNSAARLLDSKTKEFISPFVSQRDGLISQKASIVETRKQLHYLSKLRRQQEVLHQDIVSLGEIVTQLQDQLRLLQAGMPSSTKVVGDVGDILNDFLKMVSIKRRSGVGIDQKTFLPVLRNRIYHTITSGGLRTILSIGYYLSLLKYGITDGSNLPPFFMVDTVSKYLRKTKDKYKADTNEVEDQKEGLSDPEKLQNMYKYLLSLHELSIKKAVPMQIIIVDNDLPVGMEKELRRFVRARFSTTGMKGVPVGFIDDADELLSH
ncbi:MAG: hypothetical protein A2075_20935 [Geobacteraceae bacterium GWC2_58_44]|nr:MAG: hypothetical protein A2075_20935 [Geobacteraceae bacterium GWC2_58_44]HBG05254.1 exonuclease SbcC [Geobacter sp.]